MGIERERERKREKTNNPNKLNPRHRKGEEGHVSKARSFVLEGSFLE